MVKGIMAMFRKKTPSNWIEGMSWELKTTRFLSIFTLLIQEDLQKPIVYCSIILIGIIYSNLNTILKLK